MIGTKTLARQQRLVGAAVMVIIGIAGWYFTHQVQLARQHRCAKTTLEKQVAQADLIVAGSVWLVRPTAEGAEVIIAPDRLYQGQLPSGSIRIPARASTDSEANPGPTGELHLASNQPPYLLFLRQRTDGRYDTSRCFGSRTLGSGLSAEESQLLGDGQAVQ